SPDTEKLTSRPEIGVVHVQPIRKFGVIGKKTLVKQGQTKVRILAKVRLAKLCFAAEIGLLETGIIVKSAAEKVSIFMKMSILHPKTFEKMGLPDDSSPAERGVFHRHRLVETAIRDCDAPAKISRLEIEL